MLKNITPNMYTFQNNILSPIQETIQNFNCERAECAARLTKPSPIGPKQEIGVPKQAQAQ